MTNRLDITGRLHERMLDVVRAALPLITTSMAEADLAGLAHLREEMVEAIEAYCRHVREIVAMAREGGDCHAIAHAELLTSGCAGLQSAYEAFRLRWAHRHAAESWHEYRLSAVVMMKKVRNHVQAAARHRTLPVTFAA